MLKIKHVPKFVVTIQGPFDILNICQSASINLYLNNVKKKKKNNKAKRTIYKKVIEQVVVQSNQAH